MGALTLNTASRDELKAATDVAIAASTTEDDNFLEALAEAAYQADRAFKQAKERAEQIKGDLKQALEQRGKLHGDTKGIGVIHTVIKPSRRFDPSLAEQLLKPEEIEKYSTLTLDSAKVKANVTPDTYELMQKQSGWSLELKAGD